MEWFFRQASYRGGLGRLGATTMTDENQYHFHGLLGDEQALKREPRRKRRALKVIEEPWEMAKTTAERKLPTGEAVELTVTGHFLRSVSEVEVVEVSAATEPASGADASGDSTPATRPAAEIAAVPAEGGREAPEPAAGVRTDVAVFPKPGRLFFLTNQMNLNGILSSRMLAPRESFHKYYVDLLELSPGWVPLLAVQPTAQLVERVVAERGAGAPVLVELSESVLIGRELDSPVTYVRAAHFSNVVAIHFREESALRQHRAREYSNVHPHEDLLRVSPELFTSASHVDLSIEAPEGEMITDWLQIDRARGAVNGLLAAGDSGEGLAVAAGALGAPQIPKGTLLPKWLTWEALAGMAPPPDVESEAELADRMIFEAAYRILGERDRAAFWSSSEVLEAVANEIAAAQSSPRVQALVDRDLKRVRELVNIEGDFQPFRNPESPHVAAKSLLMVLLRLDLEQLLRWPAEETGADPTTRAVSAVLAGRLRGLARESVRLRNRVLDDITAAQAVQQANDARGSLGPAEFKSNGAGTALLLKGTELRAAAPLLPRSAHI
ncbi:hypothetical protein [Kocuria arenosa]|uniref:hypothetical protein n=1 Tax=Kocuria arenosa TaxID=3071446 RepID=UPI0034D437DF